MKASTVKEARTTGVTPGKKVPTPRRDVQGGVKKPKVRTSRARFTTSVAHAQKPLSDHDKGKRQRKVSERFTAPRAPFVLMVLLLITAGLVGLVLLNTAINENAFRLHELHERQQQLDLAEQQLERDVASLESSGSLDAAARRLGLVKAGTPAFIELPSGRIIGTPSPAGAGFGPNN